MERHQIDKNDLAIKSEIISMVSYNLRKYERAYEAAFKQDEAAFKQDEADVKTTTPAPTLMEEIFKNIQAFFANNLWAG